MANPLLAFWHRLLTGEEQTERRTRRWRVPTVSSAQASATIFLVLRRMRAPLIVLIVIFAVGVLGLTLIPGQDAAGQPWRMGFFDAFYFMSYTASTIGFGEIPHAVHLRPADVGDHLDLPDGDRLGLRDRVAAGAGAGSQLPPGAGAAALHAARSGGSREPFVLIAGYGQTGELLARSLDALGRRFVVIDSDSGRIDDL